MIRCDNRPATKMTPRQRLLPGMLRRVRRLLPGRSASCCCWRCRAAALDDRAAAGSLDRVGRAPRAARFGRPRTRPDAAQRHEARPEDPACGAGHLLMPGPVWERCGCAIRCASNAARRPRPQPAGGWSRAIPWRSTSSNAHPRGGVVADCPLLAAAGPCRDGARENFGEMLSVSDFLNTFDLSLDDLRNSIKMLE